MIDLDLLATHLRNQIADKGISGRGAADEIGCSPATLGRLLKGSDASNIPDTKTVLQAVSWLGMGIEEFQPGSRPATANLAKVELHLRALSTLTPQDKETLVRIVRSAHDAFTATRSEGK